MTKLKTLAFVVLFFFIAVFAQGQESYFYNNDGSGRLHLFDAEQAAVLSSDGFSVTATEADGKFSRSIYDKNMHLVSKVVWKQAEQGNTTVSSITDYVYKDGFDFPVSSVVQTFSGDSVKTVTNTTYNSSFMPLSEIIHKFQKEEDSDTEKKIFVSETNYLYNNENLLTEKTVVLNNDGKTKTEKTVLQTPGNERSGFDFFVDDVLQKTVKYTNDNEYSETIFFPGGQSLIAYYKDGRLVEEVFCLDDKNQNRRNKY